MPSSDPTHDSASSKLAILEPSSPPIPLMSTRTPAMIRNATRRLVPATRSVRVAVVVAVVLASASVVGAEVVTIDGGATAGSPAERIIVSGPGLLFPMATIPRCDVLNNFGGSSKTYGPGGHQGVDIGADLGQEVYAVEDGVLYRQFTDLGSAPGYGWGLIGTSDTQYRYYHLSAFAADLAQGDTVRQGQLIGYVGDTGNATPGGYHLHFEVRPGPSPYGNPVDPVPLLAIPRTCKIYPKQ
jgi:murein DD-endopeptidase MepM/ murein hydrolase activator NlpD